MLLQNNPNKDYDGFPTKPSSNFANMLSLISVALRHVEADKGCVSRELSVMRSSSFAKGVQWLS